MIVQGKIWGETRPLFNKNNVELHYIHIKKGGYCSKHLHKSKYNKFMVIYGKLKITIWKDYGKEILEDVSILKAGQECTVAPGDYHRFEAIEDTQALEIYYVELRDDDISRLDHGGLKSEAKTNKFDATESKKQFNPSFRTTEYKHENAALNAKISHRLQQEGNYGELWLRKNIY